MSDRCEHGNLLLSPASPWPASQHTPYCRRCWLAGRPGRAVARPLPCVREGSVVEFCRTCGPLAEGRHVRDCDRHGRCTRAFVSDAVASCDRCPDYDAGPVVVVRTDGMGIGDAVSQLYACCGLADATGRPVVMKSRHDLGWFAGVSHPGVTILPHDGTGIDCNPDYPGQCRAADAGTVASRCQWYCDRLADALGVPRFAPSRPKTVARPPAVRESGYAVLAPFSLHAGREWPADRWRELADALAAGGRRVVAVDRPGDGERLRALFGGRPAEWHWGNPPAWTAALIAHADLFAGNDSGMSHVAGLYGTPGAVVMTLFPFDFVFAEAPSLRGVGRHRGSLADVPAGAALAALDAVGPADAVALARRNLHTRATATEWLFREIVARWPSPRVVETGCVRSEWDWGAGYFGWLCGALLDRHGGGGLVSVDLSPANAATARRLCRRWPRVTVVEADSVAYLRSRTEPIDVAYLDSLDVGEPGCAEHGLAEAAAVEPLMSVDGLIAFDDTPPDPAGGWQGKGSLAVPWLLGRGWRVHPVSGYQTILERGPASA